MATKTRPSPVISKAPCAKCPFRKDVPIYLRLGRREEIARSVADGLTFWCHETTVATENGEALTAGPSSAECAGAAKAVMLSGGSTQSMRIAERLGMVDLDEVAARGVEVWSLHEWTELEEGSTGENPIHSEVETCSYVGPNCTAPIGYMGSNGGVVRGTEAADAECVTCGEAICSSCLEDYDECPSCRGDDADDDWE